MNVARKMMVAAVLLVSMFAFSCGSGCTSARVRDQFVPMALDVYERILPDVHRGIDVALAAGEIEDQEADHARTVANALKIRLENRQREEAVSIDFENGIQPWATRGIQDRVDKGEISESSATSFYDRIVNFKDLLNEMGADVTGRAKLPGTRTYAWGGHYFGKAPRIVQGRTHLVRHNEPRRILGVALLSSNPSVHASTKQ